jgi:hypothetical protein
MYKKLAKLFLAVPFILLSGTSHSAEFGVFSDVTFSDSGVDGENSQFALGALDFYGTAKVDDKTRIFIEYVFENSDDGLITDLERLWIARTISDELTVGLGRFHSPLGYWNRTYHHGAILQDTVSRPFFLDFEDGVGAILPTHIIGLLTTGNIALPSGDLNYEAYIANGPSIDTSIPITDGREIEINDSGDPNSNKSIGFRTTYAPGSVDLSVSFFTMVNTVADTGNAGADLISQRISGVDLNYQTGDLNLIAEYYNLRNKDEMGSLGTQTGTAYYIQLGYQFITDWKISVRHEAISTKEENDRYFKELGVKDASHNVVAVRFDLDDTNALKLEVNRSNPDDSADEDTTAYVLQWSFLMP